MSIRPQAAVLLLATSLGLCLALGGCKNDSSSSNAPELTVVTLSGADLNADGTLSESAIPKIDKASAGKFTVTLVRAPLTNAGLNQLSKYKMLRRVEAIGSRITPSGIEKLKQV